jgi:protein-S-isoprenylcysteine O-methyltransferase Ste14
MPHFPALIFGVLLTIYWGRVVRLVYKVRKTTGKSANFRPPERLGRLLRFLWIPIVVLWIAQTYVAGLVPYDKLPWLVRPFIVNPILNWTAVVVGVLALAATLVCWKKMGKDWRMGINPDEKTHLIVSGPYAYVRHPIYALSSILMLATLAVVPSPLMLAVGLVHLLLLQWEARREEHYLVAQHGEAYADYRRRVGRFIPISLDPYVPGRADP